MKKATRAWIDDRLSQAEENATCYVAFSRKERVRFQRAMREGTVIEVAPNVFARSSYWSKLKASGRMRHMMQGLQALHPDWVFAGPSAAVAWGLAVSNRYLDKLWLATTRKAHGKEKPYCRAIIVSHDEPVEHAELCLTSLARTVGDCLRIMDFRSGLAVADSALRVSGLTGEELLCEIESACEHMAGIKQMRRLMLLADGSAESGGESIARATMLELGLAKPELQLEFPDPLNERALNRVDFAWSVSGSGGYVVGELDGFEKYDNPEMTGGRTMSEVIADEHRRQSHLEMCREVVRVARFGFSDVMHEHEFLALLMGCGVARDYRFDAQVLAAGGVLRCRE